MALKLPLAHWLGLQVTTRVPKGCLTLFHARGKGYQMPKGFEVITEEPQAEDLAEMVDYAYTHDPETIKMAKIGMGEKDLGVVIGGTGEPLLRLDTICEAAEIIRQSRHGIPMRLSTTGLGAEDSEQPIASRLSEAGFSGINLFIPSADPKQYQSFMNAPLHVALGLIESCTEFELPVKVITVSAPGVDVDMVARLGQAMGAIEFETKKYYA